MDETELDELKRLWWLQVEGNQSLDDTIRQVELEYELLAAGIPGEVLRSFEYESHYGKFFNWAGYS